MEIISYFSSLLFKNLGFGKVFKNVLKFLILEAVYLLLPIQ